MQYFVFMLIGTTYLVTSNITSSDSTPSVHLVLVFVDVHRMNAYKLPILQSIIVYPLQADDFLRPSYLQRAVCNKIITFTAQHISSWQGANRVICTIELVYKQQKIETYIVSFLVPNTVVWYGESITRYGEGELVEGADRFGAVINSSTQVIIDKEKHELILNSHAWNFASLDGNLAKMWLSHESLYRSLHSSAVISAIFGLTNNLFEDHSKTTAPSSLLISERAFNNRSRAMAMGTLLLTGPSGSGTTTLANSIGAQYGAATICITAGSLYATSSTRDFSREWAQQQVQTNVMRACALRRCVLIFDDLHYLTPRRGSGGSSGSSSGADASAGAHSVLGVGAGAAAASHTDAEEGFIEAIVKITKSISSLVTTVCGCDNESLPSSDPLQLLLVGCAYDERMVDPRVVDCFQEKVAIPLPTAQERRKLMRSAWSNVLREKQAAVGAVELKYPGRVLDALADAQAGVALVPLYHYCQRCVGSLLQQQRQNDTSQENEQGNVISEAFGRVAGLSAVKTKLLETVLWPRRHAAVYRSFAAAAVAVEAVGAAPLSTKAAVTGEEEAAGSAAVSFAAGILLFGPPGTGKTLLPRVLAEELGCSLVDVRISDVVRGEVGTSERRVAQLFQEAKSSAPCVVFIDEFQALFTARDDGTSSGGGSSSDSGTLTAALAGCFDDINTWNKHAGAGSLVTVIASTNEPWAVDPAFLRPGRLDMCVFVGPLDAAGREQLLLGNLRSQQLGCNTLSSSGDCSSSGNGDKCAADTAAAKLSPNKVSRHMAELCRRVAGVSEGFTGADLTLLLSRATELSFLRRRPAASLSPTAVLCSATTAAMDSVEEGGQCAAAAAVCSSEGLPPSNQVEDEVEVETELQWEDFETALQNTRASTTPGDVEEYLDWQRQYPYLL